MIKRHRLFLLWGACLLALVVLSACLYGVMNARSFQFFDHITSQINTKEKVIALTLDDGPTDRTEAILATLNRTGIKGTFYLIGSNLSAHPELGRLIAQNGHEIGNHTYSHKFNVFRSVRFLDAEIARTNECIRETGYMGPITFRPPYGKKLILLPYVVHRYGMETVTWSLEPNTALQDDPDKAVRHVLSSVHPGSIIVMHPMDNTTSLDVLEAVITALQKEGYRFVTVSELLAMK